MRAIWMRSAAVTLFFCTAVYAQNGAQDTAQNTAQPVALTLRRAIELALQNSKDIQVARIQASIADRAAMITKAQFLPNLYAGSGAGYTYGIPETPGGRAPALFSVT
jgi:outer membrane protein TolC